ncbi:NUDIX hydrolase [Actinomadura rudentiformis]|uniref:NUDIX hydrolase n=1 Tax=Actinomadura rudentiformis TaxID=359158 RepID=A0A6H9Z336_9ACTN|nr:NUDIX hydrolase [Actinomadura rudentiformis]KAB2347770.1 NUDIX hydrolase [Actinomadura rudentiformis]
MNESGRRRRYDALRKRWPELFANPAESGFTILVEPSLVASAEAEEAARLSSRGLPAAWSSTGVVYEDPYLIVVRDAVRRPDGRLGTYVRTLPASGAAGAVVLPILDGQIVLVRHFRHATRTWQLEAPRGFGEPGMSMVDLARQELREEIGADSGSLVSVGRFRTNSGMAVDSVELFVAEIDELGQPQTDEGISGIELHSPNKVTEMIRTDMIDDSFTIGIFTRAWLNGHLPGLPALGRPNGGSSES